MQGIVGTSSWPLVRRVAWVRAKKCKRTAVRRLYDYFGTSTQRDVLYEYARPDRRLSGHRTRYPVHFDGKPMYIGVYTRLSAPARRVRGPGQPSIIQLKTGHCGTSHSFLFHHAPALHIFDFTFFFAFRVSHRHTLQRRSTILVGTRWKLVLDIFHSHTRSQKIEPVCCLLSGSSPDITHANGPLMPQCTHGDSHDMPTLRDHNGLR